MDSATTLRSAQNDDFSRRLEQEMELWVNKLAMELECRGEKFFAPRRFCKSGTLPRCAAGRKIFRPYRSRNVLAQARHPHAKKALEGSAPFTEMVGWAMRRYLFQKAARSTSFPLLKSVVLTAIMGASLQGDAHGPRHVPERGCLGEVTFPRVLYWPGNSVPGRLRRRFFGSDFPISRCGTSTCEDPVQATPCL